MTNADKKVAAKAKKEAAHLILNSNKNTGSKPIEFMSLEDGVAEYNEELAFDDFLQND